ncbi:DNA polymerase III subunit epsilon [Ktedonobacter sp. SOSP1-52]|uniref:exonuclease domain-containing protein n=1 Tax=Ktedonobacter sp. SOSP1-52 TaxID=2778366 RepID=UPI001916AE18|nr:exonuclease domain-containing protein [Ktedonobacter sp. SOSP1-52]GHO64839.1 DNA polymerase III subunit epsilon [Ktedonobacter sp. SOSP1-52]
MAKKSAIRIALDLETTGLHAEQDAILEVAAIKFQGSEVLDTFETFISPGRSIPYRVQRLTGIKPELLVGAPPFDAISRQLHTFLGDYPIVGHSIPFDVGFLRRWGLARSNPMVDTFELATVLLPSLSSYNLGQVAHSLGIQVPSDRHRAMVDTVLAMQVFLSLYERLQTVDLALLQDLAHLDGPRSWPLLHFFRHELRLRQEHDGASNLSRGILGDRFAAQLGMDPRVLSFAIARKDDAPPPAPTALPVATTAHIQEAEISAEAPFGTPVAHEAVYEAFEQRKPLVVEVTIGDNDYTPVLLSALRWLNEPEGETTMPRRLVIACANQQGARRLVSKTLPTLQNRLESQLSVAYLAERGGYLCAHRWFGAALRRTSGELTAEQARGLAKLGLWAQQTLTGERGELTLLPQESAAWERISSGVERLPSADPRAGSIYQRCTYRRKGLCFVSLAEERVKNARIVVTTHAGLFDDLSSSHSLLSGIEQRVVLDSDLLDEENARWSGAEFRQEHLLNLLNTIGAELPTGRYQGLLALAAPSLRENGPGGISSTPTVAKAELDQRMLSWFQTLRQARAAVEQLFKSFQALIEDAAHQGNGKGKGEGTGRSAGSRSHERLDQPLRLTSQSCQIGAWNEVEQTWKQAAHRLQSVIDLARQAEKIILAPQKNAHKEKGSGEDSSLASELAAAAHQLLEQKRLAEQALSLGESESVYWLRMPPTPVSHAGHQRPGQGPQTLGEPLPPILHTQLVQTSALLRRLLLREQRGTIFAGTALSVDGSFAFTQGHLGLESEQSLTLSIERPHHEQTLLYLMDDVPEPNVPQYQRHLDETIVQMASALEGQTVVLFTSHAALRSSYTAIKPMLEARGILVLGQGIDGSPRNLWQIYREQEHVVLLGTGSFWDAGDDVTISPTCLIVSRLPMPVLHDPPIAARAELISDQLHNLTVPMAALRVRRALNKIAWHNDKRNAVIMFDKRVVSKEYGAMVLQSLPRCSQRRGGASRAAESVLDWLTDTGSWE